jgi:hypothetical protein
MVTVAPGIEACFASTTRPVMRDVPVWANDTEAARINSTVAAAKSFDLDILVPPDVDGLMELLIESANLWVLNKCLGGLLMLRYKMPEGGKTKGLLMRGSIYP